MLTNAPSVRATVTCCPALNPGGLIERATCHTSSSVIPHGARLKIGAGNLFTEHYLGVCVKDAADELSPGLTSDVTLVLMYWPNEKYEDVVPGATFTLREGPHIVGFGRVVSEQNPPER